MFDYIKLNDILHVPAGYRTTDALFLTYSLNLKVLNDLLLFSGITKTYFEHNRGKEFPTHVTCIMQKNRAVVDNISSGKSDYYARLLHREGSIVEVVCKNKSVHPKLMVFLYEKKKGEVREQKIRLIISSKNMTTSEYMEGAICLEGIPESEQIEKNNDMIALIQALLSNSLSEEQEKLLDALHKTDFTESIRRITANDAEYRFCSSLREHTILQEMPFNAEKVRIISPFLGNWEYTEEFLKKRFGTEGDINHRNWKIITREGVQPELLPGGVIPSGGKFVYPHKGNVEKIKLHAKLYAFKGHRNPQNTLLIGSANFSENGLERNHELMLKITTNDINFVDLLDQAELELNDCIIDEEPQDEIREDAELQPEECTAEELIELILRELETDNLAEFLQYILDITINREYMIDEFIHYVVNNQNNESIRTRVKEYIKENENFYGNPYIKEVADALHVEE